MQKKNTIVHQGEVIGTDGHIVQVRVWQESACSSCAVAQLCKSAEAQEKIMSVPAADASAYAVGDVVFLHIDVRHGLQATLLAYVVPLVLMVGVLVLVQQFQGGDGLAAAGCLLVLVLYYGLLYTQRGRISRKFEVKLIKQ